MKTAYVPVNLDYDDYVLGSPGQMFSDADEAIAFAVAHHYNTVHKEVVWDSVREYEDWLNGGKIKMQESYLEFYRKLVAAGLRG